MTDLPDPLAQCQMCFRIMHRRHLRSGHCRDRTDCAGAYGLRWRARQAADARKGVLDAVPEDSEETDG
jgi:hypothetical protein